VEVREVRADEYEQAGTVVVAAYRALPGAHMSDDYARELADVERRASEAEVLVAVDDRLVGCVTFVPDATSPWAELIEDGEAAIRMLAVDPSAQGRGVGRALLGACLDRARRLGRAAVFLHSAPWMQAAHHLYAAAGFVRVPARDWAPRPEVPLLAFRRELTDPCGPGEARPPRGP
jgi:ribosomal protein S18 acetylase RimI-like enzyme